MSPKDVDELCALFTGAGVGELFGANREERASQVVSEVQAASKELERRFGRELEPPLLQQMAADPTGLKPLIQAFAVPMTAATRAMVYCILTGASVRRLSYEYEYKRSSRLVITLEFDSGETSTFESDNLWDAEVLRHFGFMKPGGEPVVDGYYALRGNS
jgi:hypothetical protein